MGEGTEDGRTGADSFRPSRRVESIEQGGLDCRFLASRLKPTTFKIASLTTIATPHRGSPFADYVINEIIGRESRPFVSLSRLSSLPLLPRLFHSYTLSSSLSLPVPSSLSLPPTNQHLPSPSIPPSLLPNLSHLQEPTSPPSSTSSTFSDSPTKETEQPSTLSRPSR